MLLRKYRDYFDIDPEYFSQVNEDIINNHPDHWKKFYPHRTFVRLVKDTISILSRKQRASLWVEGAYGTGKSHAVLTLKKILEASEKDTKQYFERYKEYFNGWDLFNSLQQIKNGQQKILTVHRYGSSNIYGDGDLVFAIQKSISDALSAAGFQNCCSTLKDAAIKWLSQDWAKNAFNELIKKPEYVNTFGGDDVDTIISNLNTYTDEALESLMSKIMRIGKENRLFALTMDVDDLAKWIIEVIKENHLKAIVFIWDEFTEYFRNNMKALTGFQRIVDISGNDPFYMIIVTHNVTHIFHESDKDWKKIMDRFVQPICNIELPENMAFNLMGEAMEESKDPVIQNEWKDICNILYGRTYDTRKLVKDKAGIGDDELKRILPIHPYAALLLKYISSAFNSNQRSMFDFIKNNRGDEVRGFQWFIDNYGPYDENPLLTIDMLWDFFYEKGKDSLSHDIRVILDCYSFATSSQYFNDEEKRVLKTVLLLQAISQRAGDHVELFLPNERNLNNAFEGSDLSGVAANIVNKLIPDVLFKKTLPGGKTQYSALINSANTAELEKAKEILRQKSTSDLLKNMDLESAFSFSGALPLRYELRFVSKTNFKTETNKLRTNEDSFGNKIIAVVVLAKDDIESTELDKMIKEAISDESYHMIFIDASINPLGKDLMEQYVDAMSNAMVSSKQDRGLASQYESNANDILKKWCNKIVNGEFLVYTSEKKDGERVNNFDQLETYLCGINKIKYPEGLENGQSVNATMWQATSLPAGVVCGAEENVSGLFRSSNVQNKLENYIGSEAWKVEKYWEKKPYLPISKIKIAVKKMIDDSFEENGQISIKKIYSFLCDKNGRYGFMACNLTAFVMGFLLKEYKDGSYNWTDGIHNEPLTVDKLKEMVAEIIKHQITPIPRYKDKFISTMTPEEKKFNEASSRIFDIPLNLCVSAENTRDRIRQKMKEWSFPIWVLKYNFDGVIFKTSAENVSALVDCFCGIANNNNLNVIRNDKEIAITIGKLCIDHLGIIDDMVSIVKPEMISKGMDCYLHSYFGGELISCASKVGDNGQYINCLKNKFQVDAANWVWNMDTANQKIDEVILEYKIIIESNKFFPKNTSFEATIKEWCDCCSRISISYLYAKNYWNDLSDFMELLFNIKKSGNLLDSKRSIFLKQLLVHGEAFNNFYRNQIQLFKTACSYMIGKLGDDEVKEIVRLLPNDVFTMEKDAYQTVVEDVVKKFSSEQRAEKLKKFWKQKTGFETPKAWSKKHRTPILCMIDDKDIQIAKEVFDSLNQRQPTPALVDKAMQFLENATFFSKLSDNNMIDEAFRATIIKSYSVLLDDLDEVRSHLEEVIATDVYDWFGLPEVDKKLCAMAEYKYNLSGSKKALEKIDKMDVSDVKQYLIDLIHDNMIVGMEIIKGK